jgi:histidyl-tRNA synthetase
VTKIQAPRGTFDVLPDDADAREAVEREARRILEGAGYRRIETPAFEATELFARGVGEATDIVQKEMFTFEDQGGRSMTLRPEGTAPVCRAYVEHGMHKLPQPVRLWYLSSFFRHEAPQAGRFRQFWQVGVEAMGSDDPAVDAETIVLLADFLDALNTHGVKLKVSSLGTPETRADYREELQAYLRAHADQIPPNVRERIDLNPLRAFDAQDDATRALMAGAPKLLDRLTPEDADHFAQVRRLLEIGGVPFEVDPTLVRGLDYYTRTVFEFESSELGAQSGVGGGGRYDRLVEMIGGPPTPGCGWAAGVERILLAADRPPVAPPPVDIYVSYTDERRRADAFEIRSEASRAGLRAQMELAGRSLKGQLKQADRVGALFVAILGEDGAELKDMESGEQRPVAQEMIVREVLRGRGVQ